MQNRTKLFASVCVAGLSTFAMANTALASKTTADCFDGGGNVCTITSAAPTSGGGCSQTYTCKDKAGNQTSTGTQNIKGPVDAAKCTASNGKTFCQTAIKVAGVSSTGGMTYAHTAISASPTDTDINSGLDYSTGVTISDTPVTPTTTTPKMTNTLSAD